MRSRDVASMLFCNMLHLCVFLNRIQESWDPPAPLTQPRSIFWNMTLPSDSDVAVKESQVFSRAAAPQGASCTTGVVQFNANVTCLTWSSVNCLEAAFKAARNCLEPDQDILATGLPLPWHSAVPQTVTSSFRFENGDLVCFQQIF